MSEDSKIKRLREYINLSLRRHRKVDENEKHGIFFLFEEGIIKSRKSKVSSEPKRNARRSIEAQSNYASDQERNKKIEEEIGRSYHTINNDPYSYDQVHDDLQIEIFPVDLGQKIRVVISNDEESFSKDFATEDEANVWARSQSLILSKKITQ